MGVPSLAYSEESWVRDRGLIEACLLIPYGRPESTASASYCYRTHYYSEGHSRARGRCQTLVRAVHSQAMISLVTSHYYMVHPWPSARRRTVPGLPEHCKWGWARVEH
jgi:hypothetical protein